MEDPGLSVVADNYRPVIGEYIYRPQFTRLKPGPQRVNFGFHEISTSGKGCDRNDLIPLAGSAA
jgi:hypothetical protein